MNVLIESMLEEKEKNDNKYTLKFGLGRVYINEDEIKKDENEKEYNYDDKKLIYDYIDATGLLISKTANILVSTEYGKKMYNLESAFKKKDFDTFVKDEKIKVIPIKKVSDFIVDSGYTKPRTLIINKLNEYVNKLNKKINILLEKEIEEESNKKLISLNKQKDNILVKINAEKYVSSYLFCSSVNQLVKGVFSKENFGAFERGEKSVPNFKANCPLCILNTHYKIFKTDKNYYMRFLFLTPDGAKYLNLPKEIIFKIKRKKKKNDNLRQLDKIIDKVKEPNMVRITKDRNNKRFLSITLDRDLEIKEYLDNIHSGIDLNVKDIGVHSIDWNTNKKLQSFIMRDLDELLIRRRCIIKEKIYWQKIKDITRDKNEKIKAIEKIKSLRKKEKNLINTGNCQIAQKLNKTLDCIGSKYLHIEKLNNGVKLNSYLNRNWPVCLLIEKIKSAAKITGRFIIEIYPAYTSQRCSKCGHISKRNRTNQMSFKCEKCHFVILTAKNSAINIVTPNIENIIQNFIKNSIDEQFNDYKRKNGIK